MQRQSAISRPFLVAGAVVVIAVIGVIGWAPWRSAPDLLTAIASTTPSTGATATPAETAQSTATPSVSPTAAEPTPSFAPSPRATPPSTPIESRLGAVPSDGCAEPLKLAGDAMIRLSVDGTDRVAIAHMPPGLSGRIPIPLVVAFHGTSADAEAMMELSNLSEEADAQGFLVVYPNGLGEPTTWNA